MLAAAAFAGIATAEAPPVIGTGPRPARAYPGWMTTKSTDASPASYGPPDDPRDKRHVDLRDDRCDVGDGPVDYLADLPDVIIPGPAFEQWLMGRDALHGAPDAATVPSPPLNVEH